MEDKNRELNVEELEQGAGGLPTFDDVKIEVAKVINEDVEKEANKVKEAVESLKTVKDRASGIVTEVPMVNRFKEWW